MNLTELQKRLLAVARRNPPGDAVPYRFERRIMARLGEAPQPAIWLAWSRALWLGAAACTLVAICAGVWAPATRDDNGTSFSEGIEQTIMASSDDLDSAW
ncbi:MAG: hypothetical protein QOF48_2903 [Verrucomicrobiota bacterium]